MMLIDAGADVNAVNQIDGNTPLHSAAIYDLVGLMQRGADVDVVNKKGDTPLHVAARNKSRYVY